MTIEKQGKAKLANELKHLIIERLEIDDIEPEDVPDDSPIFGEGLGLDSLDALDLVVLLEKKFNVKIENPEQARQIFSTIDTLAEYISVHGSFKLQE